MGGSTTSIPTGSFARPCFFQFDLDLNPDVLRRDPISRRPSRQRSNEMPGRDRSPSQDNAVDDGAPGAEIPQNRLANSAATA